jgi:tetratricopeptide (TPR) repeat protein
VILKVRFRAFSIYFASLILSVLIIFSCKSEPAPVREVNPSSSSENNDAIAAQPSGGLVEEIRGLTESGRLSSMLQALELIRSRDISGNEFGRMMSGINTLLIKLVYPDSPARLPAIDLPQASNYTRIIREAERGNYTKAPADSDDFFEHILPFLAINGHTNSNIYPDVLRDLARAAELRPSSVLPPYFQGIIHERERRYNEAEAAYNRAHQISDECYPALTGIARIRRLLGNTAEAAELFYDLVVRFPDSKDIKRQLAITWYENREWSRALPAIDEILQSEPRDGELLLMRAHILIEQGQFSLANASLDTYASINSSNRNYLFYRARVQAEGNRNRESALNYLRSIIRNDGSDTQALIYAARLLMESQRPADRDEGREFLQILRRIDGSSIEVLSLSLQDAVQRENWQEAQSYLNRILAARRTLQDLIDAYHIERGLGNNARALSFAREIYERDTANNDNAVIFISALIDNGRRDEASRLLEARLSSGGSSTIMSRLYFLRSRIQSNEEAALGDLRSSIFEDPRNLDALIAMFEIYHRRREERRAVYYLRQALAISPDNPRLKRYETEYSAVLGR